MNKTMGESGVNIGCARQEKVLLFLDVLILTAAATTRQRKHPAVQLVQGEAEELYCSPNFLLRHYSMAKEKKIRS